MHLRYTEISKIPNNHNVSFSNTKIFEIDGYFYVEFDNLRLKSKNNDSGEKIYIDGKVLPIFFSHKYFHMLVDGVALAEYSKSIINNLKIQFFVSGYPIADGFSSNILTNDPSTFLTYLKNKKITSDGFSYDSKNNFEYFTDIFNFYQNQYIFYDQKIFVELEKCVLFLENDNDLINLYHKDKDAFIRYYFSDGVHNYARGYTNKKWVNEGLKCLRNYLFTNYPIENKNKKIYISRSQANDIYKKDKNYKNRIFVNENKIKQIFKSKEFEIILLEGMSFLDQYKIFNEASDIAGYNGSNLFNIALCTSGKNIIEIIDETQSVYFYYTDYSKLFGHKHNCFLEKKLL